MKTRLIQQITWSDVFCDNCSFTYEAAPVFVLMENEVLRGLRQLVGWTEGDGIFCPGGSTSNMYAMNLARYQRFPEVKSQGVWALPRLSIFTSPEVRATVHLFVKVYCWCNGSFIRFISNFMTLLKQTYFCFFRAITL